MAPHLQTSGSLLHVEWIKDPSKHWHHGYIQGDWEVSLLWSLKLDEPLSFASLLLIRAGQLLPGRSQEQEHTKLRQLSKETHYPCCIDPTCCLKVMQFIPLPRPTQPSIPPGSVPISAGKAKVGMVHSVSGWMQGVQVKLWDPLRTCATPERLSGVFTTRR